MVSARSSFFLPRKAIIMDDLDILIAATKTTLLDIARQAAVLGNALQNAAPGDKMNAPNNSVQYLLSIAESLTNIGGECEKLLSTSSVVPPQPKLS